MLIVTVHDINKPAKMVKVEIDKTQILLREKSQAIVEKIIAQVLKNIQIDLSTEHSNYQRFDHNGYIPI